MTKKMMTISFLTACVSCSALAAPTKQQPVEVQIEQSKNQLTVEVHAPSTDLVGYGYYPKTLDEKIVFNRAMTILKNPKTFFAVNAEAGCQLDSKNVAHSLENDKNKFAKNAKSSFIAEYSFSCKNPSKIKDIKYHWFKSFPTTQKISVVAMTDNGQKNGEVTAKSRRFYFK